MVCPFCLFFHAIRRCAMQTLKMNVLLNFLVTILLNTNNREKLYSLLVVGNCGYTLVSNPLCNVLMWYLLSVMFYCWYLRWVISRYFEWRAFFYWHVYVCCVMVASNACLFLTGRLMLAILHQWLRSIFCSLRFNHQFCTVCSGRALVCWKNWIYT